MIDSLINKYERLKGYYNHSQESKLVFLKGDKGLGKTEVIEKFLAGKTNVVNLSAYYSGEPYLQPVLAALNNYMDEANISSDKYAGHGLTYAESITKKFIELCTAQSIIICIQYLVQYPVELLDYIIKLCSSIFHAENIQKVFIILKLDIDDELYYDKLPLIQELYGLTINEEFINFEKFTYDEIRKELLSRCGSNLIIDQNDLDYIISSASGNIRLLQIIINYLKQNDLLYSTPGGIKCNKLESGALSDVLERYIELRYKRLSDILKTTLQKSWMFGMEFSSTHLTSTFQLLQADEYLSKIEKLSNLVKHEDLSKDKYSFENDEVYLFIKNKTSAEDIANWAKILANYYISVYEDMVEKNAGNIGEYAFKSAYYLEMCNDYIRSVQYYISAANKFFSIMNYQQAEIIIKRIKILYKIQRPSEILCLRIDIMEAECYEYLGLYKKALDCYLDCVENYKTNSLFDKQYYIYKISLCTYYTSDVNKALKITEDLYKEIKKEERDDKLVYYVSSLLATLYHELGMIEASLSKFNEIMLECKDKGYEEEYYYHLRKSDCCLDMKFTVPLLKEAVNYFEKAKDYKEYAKSVHNLGTDYIYTGETEKAITAIQKAIHAFQSFGSIEVLYPLNTMGVYLASYEHDYENALFYFRKAFYQEMNAYKKMSILLNQAMCYLKLDMFDECLELIKNCEELPERKLNINIAHYSRTIYLAKAFCYYTQGEFKKSKQEFEKCFSICLKDDQLYVASVFICKISKLLHTEIPKGIEKNIHINHSNLADVESDMLLHTLRFVE